MAIKASFPYNVESPTGVLHRARLNVWNGQRVGPSHHFNTRCGYRVGDWSRHRWGKLIRREKRNWQTTKLRVCRRCYP